jgi:hypothetical protein
MVLQMYIDGKLVDSIALNLGYIHNAEERQLYVQGAINDLLERWDALLEEQELQPEFYITHRNFFTDNHNLY